MDGPVENYTYKPYRDRPGTKEGYSAVGPGWETILKCLDSTLKNYLENVISNATVAREEYREEGNTGEPKIMIGQIKEKFGGLRVYPDCIEGMSDRYRERVWGAINMAESMSYNMCEKCGSTTGVETRGPAGKKFGGRVLTLCAVHHEERENLPAGAWFEFGNGDKTV
jgi:hypothetical protein